MRTRAPASASEDQLGWRIVFGLAERAMPGWEQVRAAQIAAIVRLVPVICLTNLFNGAVLVTVLWSSVPGWQLGLWLGAILVSLAGLTRRAEKSGSLPDIGDRHHTAIWTILGSGLHGLLWAIPPAIFSGTGTVDQQLAICFVSAGVVASAALATSSVPLVMLVFTFSGSLGLVAMMVKTGDPVLMILPLVYASCLAAGGAAVGRAFLHRTWAEISLAEKTEVVSLLLREFEDSSADWLWQVDAAKRLVHVTPRFAHAAGTDPERLEGTPLFRLLAGEAWEKGVVDPALEDLIDRFNGRESFVDLELQVRVGDELRWWRLSAAPRWDAQTNFIGFRGVGSDVTEQRRSAEEIDRMARYDTLTGLANRRHFHDALRKALARSFRGNGRCALLLIDLDKFKPVNDTLGHPVGDKLLKLVALRLANIVGASDVCGRLGGDEFAIAMADAEDGSKVGLLAEAAIAALTAPFEIDGAIVRIGASIGSAVGPKDGRSVEMLLRHADLALYRAKDDGRGVHRRFEPALLAQTEKRRAIEVALREAMEEGQFRLVYQPIVGVAHGEVSGFEALLRWTSPQLGEVSPVDFIPIAEEARLLGRIGEWVIRRACEDAAHWPRAMRICVNISADQLVDPRLPAIIVSALGSAKLAPGRLELEVSEQVFLRDGAEAIAALERLQAIGVKIALDDFGTGQSALGYIRQGRFSTIKIHGSFVKSAGENAMESMAMIRAMVAMADTLGIATIAEGAESDAEIAIARRLGCGQVQGYASGEPMDSDAVRAMLAKRRRRVA